MFCVYRKMFSPPWRDLSSEEETLNESQFTAGPMYTTQTQH